MNGSSLFAFAVSIRLNTVAVAFAPDGVFQNRKRFFFSYLHPFLRWLFSHVAISFNGKNPVCIGDRLADIGSRSITVSFFDRL